LSFVKEFKLDKKVSKKYFLGIGQDGSGILLLIGFILMVLLTIVGGAALTNSVIKTKIKVKSTKNTNTFNIARAGLEAGKSEFTKINPRVIGDVLDGDDNLVHINPDHSSNDDNGILFPTPGSIRGGNFTVMVTDDNDDADPWTDSNDTFILTSTGTGPGNSSSKIQANIWKVPFNVPGAISLIDNENSNHEKDKFFVKFPGGFGAPTTNVLGVLITGDDTLDGSNNVGNGPGPDTGGLVAQEGPPGFETGDGVSDPEVLAATGFDETLGQVCDPLLGPPCYAVLSGGTGPAWDENVAEGPTETQMQDQINRLKDKASFTTTSSTLSASGFPANLGDPSNPVIASVDVGSNWFEMDQNLEGWGILLLEGRLRIKNASVIRWHGVIYLGCRSQLEMNDDVNDLFEVWGAIIMINRNDGACSGGSAEERLEFKKGMAHVYYSSDAIFRFASPLAISTLAWRELS